MDIVNPPAIEATSLYRFFHSGDEETLALRGVSIRVERGEIVAVTGPSGSGKSTLLTCLAGLDEPDGGMVRIDGERMSRRPEADRARLRAGRIGVVFQHDNLWDHLSIVENVTVAQRLGGHADGSKARALLDELGLDGRARAYPSELSGGEVARAGLAAGLANDPRVILADEPTGELDSSTSGVVIELLAKRASRGAAVLIVTHTSAVAARADRVITLRDGVIAT